MVELYRWIRSETIRSRLRRLIIRMEGGAAYSLTIREIFRRLHRVNVGLYTATPCTMKPTVYHPGTNIGRYSAMAETVRTFTRNHPSNIKSTHGFFYYPGLGKVKEEFVPRTNLVIGNGVWIGHNAIVLPPTERIGDGSIVTAGAVVCGNVPPYSIVSGFPASVTGYRFSKEIIAELVASGWWEKSIAEISADPSYLSRLVAKSTGARDALKDSRHVPESLVLPAAR